MIWLLIVGMILGYLLGSIPFALIIGKLVAKVDVREHGSGNLGGTNVIRVVGMKAGVLVIACDILKGVLAAFIGSLLFGDWGGVAAGIFAVIGHTYPIFARFKGGKGVATGAGVFLFLAPIQIIIALAVFGVVLLITKYMSLASIAGCLTAIIFFILPIFDTGIPIRIIGGIVALFVIFKHRSNIRKLRRGEEKKITERKRK